MSKRRRDLRLEYAVPLGSFVFGATGLGLGWWTAEFDGFSIASGVVSVVGLGVSAFAALAIWELKGRYLRIINYHDVHRRLENIRNEINRAISNKEHDRLREQVGRMQTILTEMDIPRLDSVSLESIVGKIRAVIDCDNRSIERLSRELLPELGKLLQRLDICATQEERGQTHA